MIGTGSRLLTSGATEENEPLNFPQTVTDSIAGGAPPSSDPEVPLRNLYLLGQKMEFIRRFLSNSVERRIPIDKEQLHIVSSEIASTVHQVIVNGSALLLASTRFPNVTNSSLNSSGIEEGLAGTSDVPPTPSAQSSKADAEIVEIDALELMAEHVHFCEICGKGFRRDANLRMHMRAHGDQFKTLEFLTKPESVEAAGIVPVRSVRFSCPFLSCRRNRNHARFRPLKTAVCARNHFRRCHCPKMYTCDLCCKKSFSVLADLKSHRKSCGETLWRCSCGTSFSRKDKLFGHVMLFEGHVPVVEAVEVDRGREIGVGEEIKEKREEQVGENLDEEFFDGLMEEIGGMGGWWMGH
ncbi:hypothetical protein HPP92_002324 [Vanilla planifolia]|uniref:C2H2-type domain-containing protein n=1 Tax=Vanilla planifolia TaxID=51239 RepID=A0A835VHU5_VANPL|nr:hypothetical protein HPP92_002324 [Vanilla planifolia]